MDVTEKRQPVEKAQEEMPTHPEGCNAQSHANTPMQDPDLSEFTASSGLCTGGTTNLKVR